MLWFFESCFPVVWVAFIVYWRIEAGGTKTTQRHEPVVSGILRTIVVSIYILLFASCIITVIVQAIIKWLSQ